MPMPDTVAELIATFQRNAEQYRQPEYKEDQLRQEFLNPFLEAFGWDMSNKAGNAPAYREVIHEDAIKIEGQTKAPDYAFRIGETRKFFLEAKKPFVRIERDGAAAYQLRRYAWSAKLPISILTNFEELAIYDCRKKPHRDDKAATGRIEFLRIHDYAENWDKLYGIFAKPSILKGSFDKYAESTKSKRGTATVDTAFLEEIETWRDELAKNLALRNKEISQRELNFAVQTIIDRIIFLRMCEDLGMEPYGTLKDQTETKDVYKQLQQRFELADAKYNSGLFHFRNESERELPDTLTPGLKIDDKVLKPILQNLYYPESPYVFKVMPADILGQVYEQFLGKVIRLTAGHVAKVEEKPEVKKAGGVYYTPTNIVEYIVQQTVGKLLEKKTPAEASKITVLDPACGSGSFLLGAFEFLLKWHRDWYVADGVEKHKKAIFTLPNGVHQLTTAEKKRILLNSIYGVDIDTQAVEVTKLSLLLKVLDGETEASLKASPKMFAGERVLPDLDKNIKCGNSLIGPEIYEDPANRDLDAEEKLRINAFDWKRAFPKIFKAGGFDAVIGNPPYIRIQVMKEWASRDVDFYKSQYRAASQGNYDIYVVFIERGLGLLRSDGSLGFICPHKFFNAEYGQPIRQIISSGKHLAHVVHFGTEQVFRGATTYTCLLVLDKSPSSQCDFVRVNSLIDWKLERLGHVSMIDHSKITSGDWNFSTADDKGLSEKLSRFPTKLADLAHSFVGTQTSADCVFVLEDCKLKGKLLSGKSKSLKEIVTVEAKCAVPFLRGKEIRGYEPLNGNAYLISPYAISDEQSQLISELEFAERFPLAYDYLGKNKRLLQEREGGKFKGDAWYGFAYPKSMSLFQRVKLIVPDYNNAPSFTFDPDGYFFKTGYGLLSRNGNASLPYLLGLLNSKLLFWQLRSIGTFLRGGYVRFWSAYIDKLPIAVIDRADKKQAKLHDRLVSLVDSMLGLHKQLAAAKTPHERTSLQSQIQSVDDQIDAIVYELYGLTAEEIAIVEAAAIMPKN